MGVLVFMDNRDTESSGCTLTKCYLFSHKSFPALDTVPNLYPTLYSHYKFYPAKP
jgi:hypothetical protein